MSHKYLLKRRVGRYCLGIRGAGQPLPAAFVRRMLPVAASVAEAAFAAHVNSVYQALQDDRAANKHSSIVVAACLALHLSLTAEACCLALRQAAELASLAKHRGRSAPRLVAGAPCHAFEFK